MAAIVVGVAGVAWAAPDRSTGHAGALPIGIALAIVAIPIAAPFALRGRAGAAGTIAVVGAGFGYAWTAIASKLLTDQLAAGSVLVAIGWLATAGVSESLALVSEMSALGRRPATRVAPVMFAVQVLVPVVLAPLLFDESWAGTPGGGIAVGGFIAVALAGTVLLAGSRVVGAVVDSAHAED